MAAANIALNVTAGGLQQNIQNQVNNAQQTLNRRPLRLKLDPKGFTQPLGKISGDMSEFQKSLDASVARTFAFGAAVGVVNKVSDAFRALAQATIEVQKELKNINVLLGLSVSNLNTFSNELFGVAKNTAQTFKTVATAATEFSRQGLSAEETLKRVNDAMILTRLSGLGAEQAVASLTAAVNGFKTEAISTTEVINRLANVDAAFAVSSKDLADALARAGSTAQGAKVQFNELLAMVTSVQQQTARGGAVIGNAFKSIFTRIQRSGVQDALEEIGVATRNVDGSFRSGITVLKDYARTYDTLTDAQKAYTAEQLAGVFQINNLKALVNDLNSSFSIYDRALKVANNSTNEANMRNQELNKTFAALIAQTTASMQQLGAALGNLGGAEIFNRLIKGVQAFADFFNKVLDPEEGNQFAIKFVKAIGSFIAGPGLIIIGGAFIKLFAFISKQAGAAVKSIFTINTETQRQQQLQQAILATIMSEESVYKKILANAGNTAAQEKIILDTLRQQTAQRAMQQKFLQQMASSAAFKGVAVKGGTITPMGGRRGAGARAAGLAGGHVPNFAVAAANTDEFLVRDFAATQEAKAIKAGTGGASPGARVAKVAFNPQKDAILNPDMVAAMGLPSGAQQIGAAGGFVPNFARLRMQVPPTGRGGGGRQGAGFQQFKLAKTLNLKAFGGQSPIKFDKNQRPYIRQTRGGTLDIFKRDNPRIKLEQASFNKDMYYIQGGSLTPELKERIKNLYYSTSKMQTVGLSSRPMERNYERAQKGRLAGGFVPSFAPRKKPQAPITLVGGSAGAVVTPRAGERGALNMAIPGNTILGQKVKFANPSALLKGPVKGDGNLLAAAMQTSSAKGYLKSYLADTTKNFFKKASGGKGVPEFNLSDNYPDAGKVTKEFLATGAKGYIFEEIIRAIQGDIKQVGAVKENAAFDINPRALASPGLKDLFNLPSSTRKIELKSGSDIRKIGGKYKQDLIENINTPAASVDPLAVTLLQKGRRAQAAMAAQNRLDKAALTKKGGPIMAPLAGRPLAKSWAAFAKMQKKGVPFGGGQFRINNQGRVQQRVGNTYVSPVGSPDALKNKILMGGAAQGFLPNFFAGPVDRALKTERKMGAKRPEFRSSPFPHVADGASQPNFAAVQGDHPEGLEAAIAASAEMQGFAASGFIPNLAAGALLKRGPTMGRNLKAWWRRRQRRKAAKGGDSGMGTMGMMFGLHQAAQFAPEGGRTQAALQGAGTGAMFGKRGMIAGAGLGALWKQMNKLGPAAQEAAAELEEMVSAQKGVSDGLKNYISLQGQLKDVIKKGDFSGADKVTAQLRDALRVVPLEKFQKEILEAGGDLKKLTDILARVESSQLRERLGEGTLANLTALKAEQEGGFLGFGKKPEEAKKTGRAIGTDLGLLLNKAAPEEIKGLQEVFKDQGLAGFIQHATSQGLIDGSRATEIEFQLRDVDTTHIKEALGAALDKEILAAETAIYTKRLIELQQAIREPLQELGDEIVNQVTLLGERFEIAAEGLSDLGEARIGSMEKLGILNEFGAMDMAANLAMRRNTAENKLPSFTAKEAGDPVPIAERFTETGGIVIGEDEQKKRDQATDEMNKNIQADLLIQKEILRVQKATESYLALSSQVLSTEVVGELGALNNYIKKPGVLGGGGRAGAEEAGLGLKSIKQLEGLFGIDLGGEERRARGRVAKFNAEEVFKSLGADVGKTNSSAEFIERAQDAIDNIDTSTSAGVRRAELLGKILEGMKKQQEVANMTPQQFAKDQVKSTAKLASTLGINIGDAGGTDEFALLLGGMSKHDQTKILILKGIEKQSADLVELYERTLKAQEANERKRQGIKLLKKEVDAQKQSELRETSNMTVASSKTIINTSTTANAAAGFVPTFSPVQKQVRRAMETERAMGGSPMVGFHPSVGLHVRDKNTQKNFASVRRDHPEGLVRAAANSRAIQGAAGGFAPNFAGAPMTLEDQFTKKEIKGMNRRQKGVINRAFAGGRTDIKTLRTGQGFSAQPKWSWGEKAARAAQGAWKGVKAAPGKAWGGIKTGGKWVADKGKDIGQKVWTAAKSIAAWKKWLMGGLKWGGRAAYPLFEIFDLSQGGGLRDGQGYSNIAGITSLAELGELFPVNWAKAEALEQQSGIYQKVTEASAAHPETGKKQGGNRITRKGFKAQGWKQGTRVSAAGLEQASRYKDKAENQVGRWGIERVTRGLVGGVGGSILGVVLAALAGVGSGGLALAGSIPIIMGSQAAMSALSGWVSKWATGLMNNMDAEGADVGHKGTGQFMLNKFPGVQDVLQDYKDEGMKKFTSVRPPVKDGFWTEMIEEPKGPTAPLTPGPKSQLPLPDKVPPKMEIEGHAKGELEKAYHDWLDARDGTFGQLLMGLRAEDKIRVAGGAFQNIGTDLGDWDAQLGKIQLPNYRGVGLKNMYPNLGITKREKFRQEILGEARRKTYKDVSEDAISSGVKQPAYEKLKNAMGFLAAHKQTPVGKDLLAMKQWETVKGVIPDRVKEATAFMDLSDAALAKALTDRGTTANEQRDVWDKLDPKLVTSRALSNSIRAGQRPGATVGGFLGRQKGAQAGAVRKGDKPLELRNKAYTAYLKGDRKTLKAMGFYQAAQTYEPQSEARGDYNLFAQTVAGKFGGIYDKAPPAAQETIDDRLKRIFGTGVPRVPVARGPGFVAGDAFNIVEALAIGKGDGGQALNALREKVAQAKLGRPVNDVDRQGDKDVVKNLAGFGSGFIPNFNKMGEVISSIAAGYKNPVGLGDVKSMNIPGVGKSYYNSQEKVMQVPGMRQPFIVPPRSSRASSSYANEVRGKFGFDPYKSNNAQGFVPNFYKSTSAVELDSKEFKQETNIFKGAVDVFKEAMGMVSKLELNLGGSLAIDIDLPALQEAVKAAVQGAVSQGLDAQIQEIVMSMAEAIVQKGLTY